MGNVVEVRVGRGTDNLVVSSSRPSISWRTRGGLSPQEAYEVQVSQTEDFTKFDTTGEVKSRSIVHSKWPGSPLSSREVRFVRVKTKSSSAWTPWSYTRQIEAPLFANRDWQAAFISWSEDQGALDSAPSPVFTKNFTLGDIKRARLYITALGLFQAKINGDEISNELLSPGWTSYSKRVNYRTFDVAKFLRPGANTIEVTLGDGWYRGFLSWQKDRSIFGKSIALLAQIEVSDAAGKIEKVVSDESWSVGSGPIQAADIYNGSIIDYRIATNTKGTIKVIHTLAQLVPMATPPVHVTGAILPISIRETAHGTKIYDFGQNMAGFVRVNAQGKSGDKVFVTHAEVLMKGNLHRSLLRTAKAEDTYFLADSEVNILEPKFTFHGFRYAEIETTAEILEVTALPINSDIRRIGNFECSNPLVNKLVENVSWSQRANFVAVPTDCPQRDERLGWTGDAQAFASTAATLFDSENFLSNWLVDLELDQLPDGAIPNFAPDVRTGDPMDETSIHESFGGRAGWGDAATIVPWALYEAYGDLETLGRQLGSMCRWVDYLQAKSASDNLIPQGEFQFGDWLDPDAPISEPWSAKCDSTYISNSFYSFSARITSRAAALVGEEGIAKKYAEIANLVASATYSKWNNELLQTATGCAIAIELEIAPEKERADIAMSLAQLVNANSGKISTGFLGTPLVMPALTKYGQNEAAYQLLFNEAAPGWLYQVKSGATSMWERWEALRPDGTMQEDDLNGAGANMISFNHYAYGAVAAWIFRNVAGIAPVIELPGYQEILFAPIPDASMDWAKASIDTRFGMASISWVRDGSHYTADFAVPSGTTAKFKFPGTEKIKSFVSGTYQVEWQTS
jgi:alpha-L-rhamnosidase